MANIPKQSETISPKEKRLLKEIIKLQAKQNSLILVNENDAFSSIDVSSNPLYATFIQPFTDIVHTGAYAVKRIGMVTGKELGGLLKQTGAAISPLVSADTMDEIKYRTKAEISNALQGLDQEYATVLNRNIDALMNQTDVWGMAFLLNPGRILGSKLLVKAPAVAADLIGGILSGTSFGNFFKSIADELNALDNDPGRWFFSQRRVGGQQGYGGGSANVNWSGPEGGGYSDSYGYDMDIGGMYEQVVQQPQQQPQVTKQQIQQAANARKKQLLAQVQQMLKDPKQATQIQQLMATSQIGQKLTQSGINAIVTAAKNNLAFNDWNTMLKKHSKNKQMQALDKQITDALTKQNMNEQQILQKKNEIVPSIKQQSKQMFIKQLQSQSMQGNTKQGQAAIQKAIQQINSIQ